MVILHAGHSVSLHREIIYTDEGASAHTCALLFIGAASMAEQSHANHIDWSHAVFYNCIRSLGSNPI